ncbi:hypothetical protein [Paenibacillus sp. KS1]|nr:hypothetical protein [Paenibacillus sp. KS1]
MKKVDWLIAAFFVTIGLVCLTVSAMYYQGDTFIVEKLLSNGRHA